MEVRVGDGPCRVLLVRAATGDGSYESVVGAGPPGDRPAQLLHCVLAVRRDLLLDVDVASDLAPREREGHGSRALHDDVRSRPAPERLQAVAHGSAADDLRVD